MTTAPSGRYLDDFQVGERFVTDARIVTAADIATFVELTGDNNPLHTDRTSARAAGFDDVIAHGLLLQSIAMGLIADLGIMSGTTKALLGVDLRFRAPVVAGDGIHVELEITGVRRRHGKGDGVLTRAANIVRSDGTRVVEGELVALMHCRPDIPSDGTVESSRRDVQPQPPTEH